tara:strand:- start:89 stop:562 length:474 start_codon:yes stop_codon:yes gene_type:complete
MDFIEKIDKMISEAENEMQKCLVLRGNKQRHIDYVSERVNNHIREVAKNYPDDPTRSLAESLSKVPDFIADSFDYLDRVHLNATVAISAYKKVKNEYIAEQNEEAQKKIEKPKKKPAAKKRKSAESRKIRDIGTRPADNLKHRKKHLKDGKENSSNS